MLMLMFPIVGKDQLGACWVPAGRSYVLIVWVGSRGTSEVAR
jgi:hypothetical protein